MVAVGRINDWKGHDVLIEAIARMRARDLIIPVQIAGDPYPGEEHLLDRLRELARRRGVGDQVMFLGYIADIEGLLDRVGIFVLPSIRPEPFGLALLEAMGRGLPCIATDAGGPRDMIEHGRTGLLVPPRDPDALAGAIEQLWRDPSLRATLGHAAAADVRTRFSIETTAQRVSALYDELLEGRPPGH